MRHWRARSRHRSRTAAAAPAPLAASRPRRQVCTGGSMSREQRRQEPGFEGSRPVNAAQGTAAAESRPASECMLNPTAVVCSTGPVEQTLHETLQAVLTRTRGRERTARSSCAA